MNRIVCALAIVLPLLYVPVSNAADLPFASTAGIAANSSAYRLAADRKDGIEHLTGDEAMAHIRGLRGRKAKAFAEAEKHLRAHGCKPTELAHVIRGNAKASTSVQGANPNYALVQSISDGNSELDLWSWDDGDNSTWEGMIYYEDYTTGLTVSWDAQIDVTTATPAPVWEEEVYAEQGGTDLLMVQAIRNRSLKAPPAGPIAAGGVGQRDFVRAVSADAQRNNVQLVRLPRPVKDWLACTVAGCGSAALGCLYGGPAWGPCFGLWCGGAALGCAGAVAISYLL